MQHLFFSKQIYCGRLNFHDIFVQSTSIDLFCDAIKIRHKGKISLEFIMEEDNMLSILIKDTGVGIPGNRQDIIFEFLDN